MSPVYSLPGFPGAMPVEGFAGGLLIGLAAAIMLLGLGRIAGVSGLSARATGLADTGAPRSVAIAFVVGLPLGAIVVSLLAGGVQATFPLTIWPLVIGGLLVGFGTRLGSGCTSGHGVCGLSRLSRRSIVATALFMASGFATVGVLRAGGWL
ncbi:MAG TPA: YeeE/YedE thiosulfate transporter family protein [Paracoccaceae bacterium]|nr:YeeE/YedE thiosulfate transporter family protein [Paracoccaceae bacterium]